MIDAENEYDNNEIEEELEPDYAEDNCFADDEEVDSEDGDDSLAGADNYE